MFFKYMLASERLPLFLYVKKSPCRLWEVKCHNESGFRQWCNAATAIGDICTNGAPLAVTPTRNDILL